VASQKNVLSTSFLSDTQATNSTCIGCRANRAATRALGHRALVTRAQNRNSRIVLAR